MQRLVETISGRVRLSGDQMRTEGLLKVESRVAEGLVTKSQFFFSQLHASSNTFCNAESFIVELTREFEADTSHTGVVLRVNTDARGQFADDSSEVTGLQAARGCMSARGTC